MKPAAWASVTVMLRTTAAASAGTPPRPVTVSAVMVSVGADADVVELPVDGRQILGRRLQQPAGTNDVNARPGGEVAVDVGDEVGGVIGCRCRSGRWCRLWTMTALATVDPAM